MISDTDRKALLEILEASTTPVPVRDLIAALRERSG
jgi:hypothetical protein